MFGREGYQGASMKAVAKAAGVSKGLLHYHFQSKEHLLVEAQRLAFQRIHSQFEGRFKQGEYGIGTALEALDSLWESVRSLRSWAPFMVETMSLTNREQPVRRLLDNFYDESMELLTQGIEKVFRAETHPLMMPAARVAWMVRTTLHGLVVELAYARTPSDFENVEQVYQDLREVFSMFILNPQTPITIAEGA